MPLRRHGARPALDADAAPARRDGGVQGPLVPHLPLAARAGRSGGQEGRRHRHRRHRHPGDRRDRRQGRPSHRVPAAAELERAAQQWTDLGRRDGRHPRALRRDLRGLRAHARRLRARARPAWLLRGHPRGTGGALGQALRRAGIRHLAAELPGDLHERRGERRVLGLHRRPHPPPRQGSGRRREADPARPRFRRPARADGDQLLRGLQPGQRAAGRHQRDADRADHRERSAHLGARLRVRHHRLRHRIRRDHRRLRPDRHPRRGRRAAARQVARRPVDLPRHDDPRLPEPVHAGRPAKRIGVDELSARHRDRRRLVHHAPEPHARARPRPGRTHARGRGAMDRPRHQDVRHDADAEGEVVVHGVQLERARPRAGQHPLLRLQRWRA